MHSKCIPEAFRVRDKKPGIILQNRKNDRRSANAGNQYERVSGGGRGAECIHDGLFYLYPKNTAARLVDIRQGDEVLETEIGKTDTTRWTVKWIDDCTYSLKYVSGGLTL
ncbi:MAG: hypothetical protein ABUL46_02070, partial [Chitinophaga rupis]